MPLRLLLAHPPGHIGSCTGQGGSLGGRFNLPGQGYDPLPSLAVDPTTPLNDAFALIGIVRHELDVTVTGVLRDVDRRGDVADLVN